MEKAQVVYTTAAAEVATDGLGVIANPRTSRLRSLTPAGASALLLVAPAAAVAAATATAAVTNSRIC